MKHPTLQETFGKQQKAELQAELTLTRRQLKLVTQELADTRRVKPLNLALPKRRAKLKSDIIRVAIPDTHGAKVDKQALAACLSDIKTMQPQEVILLGDHVDCGGFLAQHHVMGYVAETAYSYSDDVSAANDMLDALQVAAPDATKEYIEGNHECLTADHDVLTREGWKPIADVTTSDEVATLGWGGITEWQKPTALVKKRFQGDLVVSDKNAFYRTSMTPEHRVCYFGDYMGDVRYRTAASLAAFKGAETKIPVAALGGKTDLPGYSDDELRLLGWILTDGCITGAFHLYQSKPEGIKLIQDLLERLGMVYSLNFRKEREIAPINGVAIKSSQPQGVFHISQESRAVVMKALDLKTWHHTDRVEKQIPAFVHQLSQRQFHVLLDAIIAGDGHPTSKATTSASVYGKPAFLEKLQALCVVNGIRAKLKLKLRKGKPSHHVLYTVRTTATKVATSGFTRQSADCDVFCLVLPNTNFFVRKEGAVHVTGNCRVETWCITEALRHPKDAELLREALSPEFRLKLKERGISYYRRGVTYDNLPVPGVIKRGKCFYFHGFSTAKFAVAATQGKVAGNCVFGHTHRAQSDITSPISTGEIGAWNPGCLCEKQPLWQHTRPTDWTHGYAVQLISHTGKFLHLNVPIIDGASLLTSLIKN